MEEQGGLMMISEWLTKFQVVQSAQYEKIAKTYKGFKPWIEQGYISIKEIPGKTNNKVTYIKRKDLDNLLQLIESLENNYTPDKEVVKMLGFKGKNPLGGKTQKKVVLDGLISLCESKRIDYKYFDSGFKNVYLYINKEHLLYFIKTHMSSEEIIDKYGITYEKIYYLENKHNIQSNN